MFFLLIAIVIIGVLHLIRKGVKKQAEHKIFLYLIQPIHDRKILLKSDLTLEECQSIKFKLMRLTEEYLFITSVFDENKFEEIDEAIIKSDHLDLQLYDLSFFIDSLFSEKDNAQRFLNSAQSLTRALYHLTTEHKRILVKLLNFSNDSMDYSEVTHKEDLKFIKALSIHSLPILKNFPISYKNAVETLSLNE